MTHPAATEQRQQRIERIRKRRTKPTLNQIVEMFGCSRKTAIELLAEAEREYSGEYKKLWNLWPVRGRE